MQDLVTPEVWEDTVQAASRCLKRSIVFVQRSQKIRLALDAMESNPWYESCFHMGTHMLAGHWKDIQGLLAQGGWPKVTDPGYRQGRGTTQTGYGLLCRDQRQVSGSNGQWGKNHP